MLDSGWLAEGVLTRQFEESVARYVGARYGIAVCNATLALELCLKAEHVSGSVLTSAFGHPATVNAIMNAGATPILCDVSLQTYNMYETTDNVTAAMPVSWAGNPLSWYPEALIIEDAACSLGSAIDGVKTGSRYTSVFSFHPRKLVTVGEGAVITTNSKELAERLGKMKTFGEGGGNYKLDEVRAAIGIEQMKKLDQIIKERQEHAEIYDTLLSDVKGVKTPFKSRHVKHTYQTYAVLLEKGNRNEIIRHLGEKGIETQVGAFALHQRPQFANVEKIGELPNATLLHSNVLALPMAYDLTFDDQKHVVDELKHELA